MRRRTFVTHGILGAGVAATTACARPGSIGMEDTYGHSPDVHMMSRMILNASRGDVPDLALSWVERGARYRDLLAASYLAGIHEVNPSPIGSQVHAMMMVPSAAEAAGVLRGKRSLLPALFNLDRMKAAQSRDEETDRGDWRMAEAPPPEDRPTGELIARFNKSMEEWDESGADQAVTSLHHALSLHDFFEVFWPFAVRDYRIIGHKAIYAAQTYRACADLGWRSARDPVRSLTYGVLDQNPYGAFSDDDTTKILGVHERNLVRCGEFPVDWQAARSDPKESLALLERLRDADIDQSAKEVIRSLNKGVNEATVWDGLRLYAFELMMWKPSIAAVHTVTSVNALFRASVYTARESTRRISILQAASWLPLFRELLEGRKTRAYDIPIDSLRPSGDEDPFAIEDPTEAAPRAASMVEAQGGLVYRKRTVDVLSRKAQHDHDYKYAIAVIEEIAAAHPMIRPYLAAASVFQLRSEADSDNDAWKVLR